MLPLSMYPTRIPAYFPVDSTSASSIRRFLNAAPLAFPNRPAAPPVDTFRFFTAWPPPSKIPVKAMLLWLPTGTNSSPPRSTSPDRRYTPLRSYGMHKNPPGVPNRYGSSSVPAPPWISPVSAFLPSAPSPLKYGYVSPSTISHTFSKSHPVKNSRHVKADVSFPLL